MKNFNIDINPDLLNDTITSLKKDEENIKEKIDAIYENINEFTNEEIWNSPEKSVILDELLPYIQESNNNIKNELNNCTSLLNDALNKYIEDNNILTKNSQKLSTVEVIEEL